MFDQVVSGMCNGDSGDSADPIELFLFFNGPYSIEVALRGRLDALVVDCERVGKDTRQLGFDTEINACGISDVAQVRRLAPTLPVLCRINGFSAVGAGAVDEARAAVDAGATEVLLPMAKSCGEVEAILNAVGGQTGVGVMIETEWAVAHARQLDEWPLKRVFLGLHDLMIERGSRHLFENLANGTVESVRQQISRTAFGFGGLTLPDLGAPIPCRLLMAELARLGASFTFLRRSFYRDLRTTGEHPERAVSRIRTAWRHMNQRSPGEVEVDHVAFRGAVAAILQAASGGEPVSHLSMRASTQES